MSEKCACACRTGPKLIFACSGAADVGAVADQAARKLNRDGAGRMFCLAGIGGRVSGIMETTASAANPTFATELRFDYFRGINLHSAQ